MTRKKILISPSVLAINFITLGEEVLSAERAGADLFHLDIMDGNFVPKISFGDSIVQAVRASTKLPIEAHLMTQKPANFYDDLVQAGANRIIIHQEASLHLDRDLREIRKRGLSAGVALNPATPVNTIYPIIELCDLILIMTVNPGSGGQVFLEYTLKKIEKLRNFLLKNNFEMDIEVDGGINDMTAKNCILAGANILVAGSYIFNSANRQDAIKRLSGE
jgi:ribulose-phosphate 3-epimerase